MTSIKNAVLGWNEAGTPVSDQFDDVYFSNVNGLEETRYVFLTQNQLPQRWHNFEHRRFVVAETGFGTGLNFLALWQWFNAFRKENPDSTLKELHFISFEKFPVTRDDLKKAHESWPELAEYASQLQAHYPIAVPDCHRIVLADGAITLDLWFGDIKDCMPSVPTPKEGLVDAWFLDGFAPSKNPEMWNQNLFDGMAKLARQDCSCATFTAAGFVRRGLIEAGFSMKKVKGFGTKREMIAGTLEEKTPITNLLPWLARQNTPDVSDIAIIGGGIASATLAQTLARRGIKTTLYCKNTFPAEEASGNRQGAVYPLLNGTHTGMSRVFAPAFLFARQFAEQMSETVDFDHDWCGVTQLAWDEKAAAKLDKMLLGHFSNDLIHKLDAKETSEKTGMTFDMESVHYPLGGWLCPQQLTRGIIENLENQNRLSCHFQTEIDKLEKTETGWTLHSQSQKFEHQVVVVANGYLFNQFVQADTIPASAVKGQVSHIPTTDSLKQLKTVLCYDGYMTPHNPANMEHCIGASYDRANIDKLFDESAQIDNAEKLKRCVPNQAWSKEADTSGNQSRQGIRCVTRDHLPFVGAVGDYETILKEYADLQKQDENKVTETPIYQDLYCMIGLGSRGLSSAPLLAELLASQICGDPMPFPVETLNDLHPSRMWVRRLRKGKAITER
ncbi:bifunctional tRNA (5-methylaminomethyl-2-thiouridine)(34)-methyltransferase MnmD/FAD-dependent 5-carboxymethylaminomethyl-2-thiouridine(34) oxidoreductase MnmC [Vibrio nigripulchritudo]|uniref:bifunctional tRNA (5-methylaminomethyl-2-thiouridine)(34)-methyltransferase MnmD/FAD-dependent 5-carboxymethylaminomethyl-2-thiouridine(34) oxidoreductase MnmC n=1 Tax=Vibrio nigripulchritudo TaxID=28173 RepID=UPI0003B1F6EE|nr:bifunctional tRNA (5-methylaminomethyl-2-thiouridine)(34)-methyltransferase MnmD/FAD-dependent 5-carboxymethylaminomethyl-2-thiouridine(34) oxidoreductase MnmC [Vibrio nigripulchritudo]CCN70412.1 tRNA 5-methylaminomethyl-2-thiouridine biosynthesis bifunctional protein mnmC (Includes: tRNA (mnm(5)s(2)U34)-methyltransferase; FAD-dependent cmnm(5)s(2)U34 oxidoreductase) [Vibrio nigripulchritudo SFn118]